MGVSALVDFLIDRMNSLECFSIFSLKFVTNKDKSKVLFVEAESDVVYALLTFRTLSLGKMVMLLERHFPVGSLTTLCNFVAKLAHHDFYNILYLNRTDPFEIERFDSMSRTFMISDDLRIFPFVSGFLQTFSRFGITDTDEAEVTTINVDSNDLVDLLVFALTSATPFTQLLHKKTKKDFIATKEEPRLLFPCNPFGDWTSTRKMDLKLFFQASADKFLFAEASCYFVMLLSIVLLVHLGVVGRHLHSIANLERSITEMIDNDYFKPPDVLVNETSFDFLNLLQKWSKGYEGFREQMRFFVSDDLTIQPSSLATSFLFFSSHGIPLSDVMEVDIEIGVKEVEDMILASLSSKTVLTDVLKNLMLNKSLELSKAEP